MSKVRKIQENLRDIREHSFFRDIVMLGLLFTMSISLITLLLIIFLGIRPSDVLIQLRFDSFTGVSKVGLWFKVYNLFVVGILIGSINTVLAYSFYEKERLASIFLLVAALVSEIILIVEALNIVKLVNL